MHIGLIIKQKRNFKKMSQKELSKKMKYAPSLICKWEKGQIIPRFDQVEKLEEILNLGVISIGLNGNSNGK